jgi:hypothetical protein
MSHVFFIVSNNHGVKRAMVILFTICPAGLHTSAGRPPTYCTYQSGNRLPVDQLLNELVLIYECCTVAIRRHHEWDSQRQR